MRGRSKRDSDEVYLSKERRPDQEIRCVHTATHALPWQLVTNSIPSTNLPAHALESIADEDLTSIDSNFECRIQGEVYDGN